MLVYIWAENLGIHCLQHAEARGERTMLPMLVNKQQEIAKIAKPYISINVLCKTNTLSRFCYKREISLTGGCSVTSIFVQYTVLIMRVSELQIRGVKLTSIDSTCFISLPIPMFDHLLESSQWDDSNKWSNIEFGEEIEILEIKICTLSGALGIYYIIVFGIGIQASCIKKVIWNNFSIRANVPCPITFPRYIFLTKIFHFHKNENWVFRGTHVSPAQALSEKENN